MKRTIFLSASLCCTLFSFGQRSLVICGNLTGDTKGFNKVFFTDYTVLDSTTATNGRFCYTVPFNAPVTLYAYTEYHNKGKSIFALTPIVTETTDTVFLNFNLEQSYHATISGNGTAADYIRFQKQWVQLLPNPGAKDTSGQGLLAAKQETFLTDLVKSKPSDYSTAYLVNEQTTLLPPTLQQKLYDLLWKDGRESIPGKKLKDRLDGYRASAPGQKVLAFSLPDPSGKLFSISQWEGKYVLIDFWASWCGPCRASFPHLRSLYEKYHPQGFEIVSISIDAKKDLWLKAVREEQLGWTQLLDNQEISSRGFAITHVPTLFLLDKKGTILKKFMGAMNMEDELKQLFP